MSTLRLGDQANGRRGPSFSGYQQARHGIVTTIMDKRQRQRRLDNAFFEFREIFLQAGRAKDRYGNRASVTGDEIQTLLGGFQMLAAAAEHSIRSGSLPYAAARFRKSCAVYEWLMYVRKGLGSLLRRQERKTETTRSL